MVGGGVAIGCKQKAERSVKPRPSLVVVQASGADFPEATQQLTNIDFLSTSFAFLPSSHNEALINSHNRPAPIGSPRSQEVHLRPLHRPLLQIPSRQARRQKLPISNCRPSRLLRGDSPHSSRAAIWMHSLSRFPAGMGCSGAKLAERG